MTSFKRLIKPLFRDHVFAGRSLLFLEETDSTNMLCLRTPELLTCPGLVVQAQRQTKGIGRMGRKWEQGQGNHLFCSFVLTPPSTIRYPPTLTLLCGLGVSRTIKALGLAEHEILIKWPNDILIGGKKVSGILCQSTIVNNKTVIVAGIGINIKGNADQFPKELLGKVTTLEKHGLDVTPQRLLEVLAIEIEKILQEANKLGTSRLLQKWVQEALCLGKRIWFDKYGRKISGTVTGLDHIGRLVVRGEDNKIHIIDSGQIDFTYS